MKVESYQYVKLLLRKYVKCVFFQRKLLKTLF